MQENHQRFADKYFETLNAKESAIYAGFSEDTAKQKGWTLLQREDIQEYLTKLRGSLAEKTGVTHERVLMEVARLAFSDIRKYYDENGFLKLPKDLDDDAAAALAGIEIDELFGFNMQGEREKQGESKKIKLYDKPANLEKLMKYLGMYSRDNAQLKPESPKTMSVTIVRPDPEDD